MATLAEELPFAAVVADELLDVFCSSCFKTTRETSKRCIGCKVVHYCDKFCQKKDWADHKHECVFLKNCSPEIPELECRLIARIAMKLRRDDAHKPAFNGRVYGDLVDHRNEMEKDPVRVITVLTYLRVLRAYMGEKFVPDLPLLMSIYGKSKTNGFAIMGEGYRSGAGLYLGISAHDHSCIPDAFVIFEGIKACLRSPDSGKKYSKNLTVSYTEHLQSKRDRQQKLQSTYYFTCSCKRCSDLNEDFLHNSAFSACCPDSYCLLDPSAKEMTCNKCGSLSGLSVLKVRIHFRCYQNPRGPRRHTYLWIIAANQEIRNSYCESDQMRGSCPDRTYLLMLIATYQKFSKVLSPFNISMMKLNRKIRLCALKLGDHLVSKTYADLYLPASRQYYTVADVEFSIELMSIAKGLSLQDPPSGRVLKLYEEALAASLVSHGPKNFQTLTIEVLLSKYRYRLQGGKKA